MELVFSLAALPLWIAPLALALVATVVASLPRALRGRARVVGLLGLTAAALCIAPSAGAALAGETVLSVAGRLLRVGSLDVSVVFALDRVSLFASVGVLVALGLLLGRASADERPGVVATWLVVAASGLVGVLADGFAFALVGAAVAALLGLWTGGAEGRVGPVQSPALGGFLAGAGTLAIAGAAAVLFWALGGGWLDEGRYFADHLPRFEAVGRAAEVAPTSLRDPAAKGSITIVSHPGARVYLGVADESQLRRGEPLGTTPLVRAEVPAGLHKVAIVPEAGATVAGDGFEVAAIDVLQVTKGEDARIRLWGPSLTYHEVVPQIQANGKVLARRLGPADSGAFIGFLLFLGAGLLAGAGGAIGGRGAGLGLSLALLTVASVSARLPEVFAPRVAGALGFLAALVITLGCVAWEGGTRERLGTMVKWLAFLWVSVLSARASIVVAALFPIIMAYVLSTESPGARRPAGDAAQPKRKAKRGKKQRAGEGAEVAPAEVATPQQAAPRHAGLARALLWISLALEGPFAVSGGARSSKEGR